jgi:hypothetical protein
MNVVPVNMSLVSHPVDGQIAQHVVSSRMNAISEGNTSED